MTQEEKAAAYDAAIKKVKELAIDDYLDAIAVTDIFPEIKESEGEQSKKWILEYLYDGLRKSDEQFKGQFKAAIAWIEKQDPKKHEEELEKAYKTADEVQYKRGYEDAVKDTEKQGDHKLAWSEADEKMCQETIDWFEKKCFPYALENDNPARESIKWLKSLKDRVQPKQEWTEEDKRILDALNNFFT